MIDIFVHIQVSKENEGKIEFLQKVLTEAFGNAEFLKFGDIRDMIIPILLIAGGTWIIQDSLAVSCFILVGKTGTTVRR